MGAECCLPWYFRATRCAASAHYHAVYHKPRMIPLHMLIPLHQHDMAMLQDAATNTCQQCAEGCLLCSSASVCNCPAVEGGIENFVVEADGAASCSSCSGSTAEANLRGLPSWCVGSVWVYCQGMNLLDACTYPAPAICWNMLKLGMLPERRSPRFDVPPILNARPAPPALQR